MGRERLARFLTACTECGGQVVAFAQDLPEPARCDACRAAGPPKRRMVTCSREGCDQKTMITGSQRRRWELGRPVFCSKGCRYLATHPVAHCAGCGVAMKRRGAARNRHRPTCSPACQGLLQRTAPDRTCPECGTVFRSRARVQTCSMACGIRHRDRKLRGRVATAFQWLCPVCEDLTESMDVRRLGRPCSRRCANTWRTRPDHRPVVR